MSWTSLSLASVLAAAALTGAPASAAVFEGSFAGIAYDSGIDALSMNPRNFDGEIVTGSFRFDLSNQDPPVTLEPDYLWTIVRVNSLAVTFHAAGQTVVFSDIDDAPISTVSMQTASGPTPQSVNLNAGGLDPYSHGSLTLAGPLFDALDLATLHPGPVDLEHSSADMMAGRSFYASVKLTEVSFVSSVPEPSTWAMTLCGAALVAGYAARRRARG